MPSAPRMLPQVQLPGCHDKRKSVKDEEEGKGDHAVAYAKQDAEGHEQSLKLKREQQEVKEHHDRCSIQRHKEAFP